MPVLAVGAVAYFAAAIVALLFVYALMMLVTALAQVFPSVSVPILGSLRNKIIGAISGAVNAIEKYVTPSLAAFNQILLAPITFTQYMLTELWNLPEEIITTVNWVIHTGIPRAANTVTAYAQSLYNRALSAVQAGDARVTAYAQSLYNQAVGIAQAGAAAATAEAQHLYNLAIAAVNAGVNTAIGEAESLYNKAIAAVQAGDAVVSALATQLYHQAVAAINAGDAAVTAYAQSLYNKAIAAGQAAAAAAAAAAVAGLEKAYSIAAAPTINALHTAATALVGTAAGDFTDAIAGVKSIDWTKAGEIAGGIAATAAIATSLTKLAEDCVIPNCRNLSQFGRDLQGILSILEDGAFIAFIAAAAADPAGTADAFNGEVVPIFRSTINTMGNLIGV